MTINSPGEKPIRCFGEQEVRHEAVQALELFAEIQAFIKRRRDAQERLRKRGLKVSIRYIDPVSGNTFDTLWERVCNTL